MKKKGSSGVSLPSSLMWSLRVSAGRGGERRVVTANADDFIDGFPVSVLAYVYFGCPPSREAFRHAGNSLSRIFSRLRDNYAQYEVNNYIFTWIAFG
jgi:hypothetical protein